MRLSFIALSCLVAGAASAQIVVPGANAATEGDSNNRFPFYAGDFGPMRYQQVYAAGEFGSGPIVISAIQFRLDADDESFSGMDTELVIRLSTTAKAVDGLSSTFAENIGADETLVVSGMQTLSGTGGPGVNPFDINISFATDFVYDPTMGNLLMDVTRTGGSNSAIFFDASSSDTDAISRVYSLNSATTGTATGNDTLALITRFTADPVPEPATMAVLGLGALVAARRRRPRSQ